MNVALTAMYKTLALIVNFKWHASKKVNVIAKISVILAQCRYNEIAQRIFMCSDTQYTSLTLDNKNWSVWFIKSHSIIGLIHGSYELSKNSRFFGPPFRWIQADNETDFSTL